MKIAIIAAAICAVTIGCKPPEVLKQAIPVSSNPSGAEVSVDGVVVGKTPLRLHLERNAPHIVTFQLPGYRQEDVAVRKVYQERSKLETLSAGISSAAFFGDVGMGMGSAVRESKNQEATGEAYLLEPSVIAVTLYEKQK